MNIRNKKDKSVLMKEVMNTTKCDSTTTQLHYACKNGNDDEQLRSLLETGENIEALNGKGNTPLHEAARNGQDKAVHTLLSHGANKEAKNGNGDTPLHEAARYGQDKAVHILLSH